MKPDKKEINLRIAAFGFRSVPLREGCAGADKFAMELFPRLVKNGHQVTGYNRLYPGQTELAADYQGVRLFNFRTVNRKGFDTLLHSCKCTLHIIFRNTADIVHIQNGGNSIWALFLRLAGKKVYISQDGIDWEREKWPWYGKLFLKISAHLTARLPNQVIFDNIFARELFERKFGKQFLFVPFGSDVPEFEDDERILQKLGLERSKYLLFIGRFIPDKGVHYLIPAFKNLDTDMKLVLVGGAPNPSEYEKQISASISGKILQPGYIYGDDSLRLMKYAYAYIQPSDVEGLSPVILNVMGIGTPIICSDIKENQYAVGDTALLFRKADIPSLQEQLDFAINNPDKLHDLAVRAKARAQSLFSWEKVTREHEQIFIHSSAIA